MRCKKCGAKVSKKSDFCSKCGTRIGEEPEKTETQTIQEQTTKKTITDFWHNLNKFGKTLVVFTVIFALFFIASVLNGKVGAAIFSFIQTVLCTFSLLINIEKIKVPQRKLHIILFSVALVLIFPYLVASSSTTSSAQEFIWSDIVMNEMLPEPKSNVGEIISNDNEALLIYVHKTSVDDYNEYLSACEEKGFIIEADKVGDMYEAFNQNGYKLDLKYENEYKKMCIDVEAPMKLGEIKWSETEIAKLLPIPEFDLGKIEKDDVSEYSVYLSGISYDNYVKYVDECSRNGFNTDSTKDEKTFSAKNSDDYSLNVEYEGNSIIYISIKEPEYNVDINVEYADEWFDNDNDIDIYVDGEDLGTISHDSTDTFDSVLNRDVHIIKFVNSDDESISNEVRIKISKQETLKFKITCSDDKINVETISGDIDIQVKSIKFSDASDVEFYYSSYPDTNSFSVEISPEDEEADYSSLLDFVSENPDVATIEYDKDSWISQEVKITPVSDGETYVYIQSKDGKVKSEKVKVIVAIEEDDIEEDEIEEDEIEEDDITESDYEEPTTEKKSGIIVYTTPYGTKYHYSKACAGKNASESDLDDVKGYYDPCKKCAG